MFRSLRTVEVINKRWLRFSFPTVWHYDVLPGLHYLRNADSKPDSIWCVGIVSTLPTIRSEGPYIQKCRSREGKEAGGTRASASAGMCSRLGTWSVRLRLCSSP